MAAFGQFVDREMSFPVTLPNKRLAKKKLDVAIYDVEVEVGSVHHLGFRDPAPREGQNIKHHSSRVPSVA